MSIVVVLYINTSYDVGGLTNGTVYFFKISAVNATGESNYSDVLSGMPAIGTAPINLGTAGNYAILAKTGISTVPNSVVTGDIGVSPLAATAITGFTLTQDASTEFATSTQITGKAYAADYASPTSSNLTTAVGDMQTAHTQAAGTHIILSGGVQAKNIFGQTGETVSLGTGSHFEGIVLSGTNISLGTHASINGRLLAKAAVTLIMSTVVEPSNESTGHHYSISIIGTPTLNLKQESTYVAHLYDNGTEVYDKTIQWHLENQHNTTPITAQIIAGAGNSAVVTAGSNPDLSNEYILLSATLTDDQNIMSEMSIQILNRE